MIVLVERSGARVRYLDPYFASDGQPLEVSLEDFVAWWWTGDLLTR